MAGMGSKETHTCPAPGRRFISWEKVRGVIKVIAEAEEPGQMAEPEGLEIDNITIRVTQITEAWPWRPRAIRVPLR
jgi:hypothetical protein